MSIKKRARPHGHARYDFQKTIILHTTYEKHMSLLADAAELNRPDKSLVRTPAAPKQK